MNAEGQDLVDDILTTPGSARRGNKLGGVDAVTPDGRGLRYNADGSLMGCRTWVSFKTSLVTGRPTAVVDDQGRLVQRFIYAEGPCPTAMETTGGMQYAIVSDHLCSIRQIINLADGSVVQAMDYDEYGNIQRDTNPGFTPFGYAGGIYDPDTALVHFGAREYDPSVGRFLQRDPAGFPDGGNRYSYTDNEPMNRIDPWGESWSDAFDALTDVVADGIGGAANFTFGAADNLTLGASSWAMEKLGLDYLFDKCSALYTAGEWAGTAAGLVTLAGAGKAVAKLGVKIFRKRALKKAAAKICFAAGTLVETSEGLVPIEDIEEGDKVWSRDDETGEEGWRPVVRTFVTQDQVLVTLRLSDADGDIQELRVTGEHPLWGVEGWTEVAELNPGSAVLARDGWAEVLDVAKSSQRETVYNFEVEKFHTYFVGDGGVWAHNSCVEKARSQGAQLLKKFKSEGVGKAAGRSGGHGPPFKRAGAELIRKANKLPKNDPMRNALKTEGKRLIQQGKSHNHR